MGWGFAALLSGFGCRECVGCYDGPASTDPAVGSGGGQAGEGAFANHVTSEFGEGGHHGEEEFAFSGRPVGSGECAGEDLEGDVFVVEAVGDGEDFFDGSVEAVQFSPDAENVVGSEVVERGDKPGADSDGRRNRSVTGMLLGYARVSTNDQDLTAQKNALVAL